MASVTRGDGPRMQIDFHNSVTYTVARLSGFNHPEADIIAHSAQYVDDATNAGLIRFANGQSFNHISSAHKLFDYRNFRQLANYQVWIPFHFLPGNQGLPAGENPQGSLINKLICRPNSYVAQEMVAECIAQRQTPEGLYRLGIAMHVFADTWAHQGFVGVNHRINEAKSVVDSQGNLDLQLRKRLKTYFKKDLFETLASLFLSEMFPLGHGAVLSHPDKPFLQWGYTNGLNQKIHRDNPKDYLEAADQMCRWLQRYRLGDPQASVLGLPQADRAILGEYLVTINDHRKQVRHQQWQRLIASGIFSFGPANLTYVHKGQGSWKYDALGTEADLDAGNEIFPWQPSFVQSHWKRFHDALIAHRSFVIEELLPRYNIQVGAVQPQELKRSPAYLRV